MKIAQIVCAFPPYAGGIGNSALTLEKILQKNHEVITFHPDNTKPLFRRGHGAFTPSLLNKLKDFDLIYLHYPFFGTAEIVWLFKTLFKKPKLIIHYHMDVAGLGFFGKILSLPTALIRTSLFNRSDKIVCASLDYIRQSQIKDYYLKHQDKFIEIPFGIDADKFIPRLGPEKTNSDIKTILFVGGLDQAHYFKGIDILLNAVAKLDFKNWKLIIAGEGNLRQSYKILAEELGIENQVEFIGKIANDELPKVYQDADIFVLPSINSNEAFGIVLLEAMSCGVPVIASSLPGVRTVFENNQQGLLIRPKNVDDLKDKLERLLTDDDLREIMKLKTRELVKAKYTREIMEKKYDNLIENIKN